MDSEPVTRRKHRCKCLHCNVEFLPNYRNQGRQRYCSKVPCRKARKRASQQAWLRKPGNETYFRDAQNAGRVRAWQRAHPGYWKKPMGGPDRTLQDACPQETPAAQEPIVASPVRTLQDLCSTQTPLLVGLISMLTGSTLQDDIAVTTRGLVAKGHDILGMRPGMKVERSWHEKTSSLSGTAPESSLPV